MNNASEEVRGIYLSNKLRLSVCFHLHRSSSKGCSNQLPLTSLLLTSRPTRTFSGTPQSPPSIEQLLTQHGKARARCRLLSNGPHGAGPGCLEQNFSETREPLPALSYHIMSSGFLCWCKELDLRLKFIGGAPSPSAHDCLPRPLPVSRLLRRSICRFGCHGLFGRTVLSPRTPFEGLPPSPSIAGD